MEQPEAEAPRSWGLGWLCGASPVPRAAVSAPVGLHRVEAGERAQRNLRAPRAPRLPGPPSPLVPRLPRPADPPSLSAQPPAVRTGQRCAPLRCLLAMWTVVVLRWS